MNERYIRGWTPHLSRDFEMMAFSNGGGIPLVLFPTSLRPSYAKQGFRIDRRRRGICRCRQDHDLLPGLDRSRQFLQQGNSSRRWDADAQCLRAGITHDVFDLARRECSTSRVAVCGASLGAYHAANIAFRYPDAVSHLISLSGAFEVSSFFDGYYDDNIYFNSPYDYMPNIDDPWKFNHMGIVLGTGEWDNTRHESMRLSHILNSKGIQHLLDDRRWCGHDWNYWRDMLPYYLSLI